MKDLGWWWGITGNIPGKGEKGRFDTTTSLARILFTRPLFISFLLLRGKGGNKGEEMAENCALPHALPSSVFAGNKVVTLGEVTGEARFVTTLRW
jgi:hypothetical protein